MKTYHGWAATETVTVRDLSTHREDPLEHYVRHSPDGFLWGYGGSGPSDLARCLIIDALGSAAFDESGGDYPTSQFSDLVEKLYMAYKDQVIARLDRNTDWTVSQNSILTWVRQAADLKGIPFEEPLGLVP